jgi:hypothetical protein
MPPLLPYLGLLTLLLASCAPQPNPKNYALTAPSAAALAGTYHATESTKILIAATGKYENKPASITLHPDGSIEIIDLPDCWIHAFDRALGLFDTGKGTWSIVRQQQWHVLMCKFPSLPNHATSGVDHGTVTAMISLVGQEAPYALESIISHPDADLAMRFEKYASAP